MLEAICGEDKLIAYIAKFREYGFPVQDGGSSFSVFHYCPWCGKRLPGSLRDSWFDLIEELGYDDPEAVPDDYKSDIWWKSRGDKKS